MDNTPQSSGPNVAALAGLLADPARAQIMLALMDGRALTAGELARAGGVTPQTASSHLTRLVDGGLLSVAAQGRHRYYRISGPDAAHVIEVLSVTAGHPPLPSVATGPRDEKLRQARICYDHLAGSMGVRLLDGLRETGKLDGDDFNVGVTPAGEAAFADLGLDLDALKRKRRPLCRACIDWSERRPHLAGSLGAALLDRFIENGWVRRMPASRTLAVSAEGRRNIDALTRN